MILKKVSLSSFTRKLYFPFSITMDFSLQWLSSLGNSEVRCEVVNYIRQLANQIANFETKLATSVPAKLVNSEFILFFFFAKAKQFLALSGIL